LFFSVQEFMNRSVLILSLGILVGQDRPNFAGHWELIRSGGVPARAIAIDIADDGQIPRVLSVTRYFEGGDAETRDYPFGISGRAGGISVRGGIPVSTSVQSVTWDDSAIVIDQEDGPDGELHQRWSINAGGELVIESAEKPLVLATERVTVRYRRR
jgi:hypothetical protein